MSWWKRRDDATPHDGALTDQLIDLTDDLLRQSEELAQVVKEFRDGRREDGRPDHR